jgi:hypothetical protein
MDDMKVGDNMSINRYLTVRNGLIAIGLLAIYVAILRWFENGIEPPATMFTMLPAFCPESIPEPVAFVPLEAMLIIGGCSWLIGLGVWRLCERIRGK